MKLSPDNIDEFNWTYDHSDGLLFVHQVYDNKTGALIQTDQVTVPWSHLRVALARHDKQKLPKRSAA